MPKEFEAIDVTNLPEVLALAERVSATGIPLRLVRGNEELAILQPTKNPRRRSLKGKPITADDPIWNIVGIGRSEGPGDISTNKHKYLAEAYMPKSR
jgi:hypothetical protein